MTNTRGTSSDDDPGRVHHRAPGLGGATLADLVVRAGATLADLVVLAAAGGVAETWLAGKSVHAAARDGAR